MFVWDSKAKIYQLKSKWRVFLSPKLMSTRHKCQGGPCLSLKFMQAVCLNNIRIIKVGELVFFLAFYESRQNWASIRAANLKNFKGPDSRCFNKWSTKSIPTLNSNPIWILNCCNFM